MKERSWDHTKEHYMLKRSDDNTKAICIHCGKVVEERAEGLPDYFAFMGGVWIGQNLPCNPYKEPIAEVLPMDITQSKEIAK